MVDVEQAMKRWFLWTLVAIYTAALATLIGVDIATGAFRAGEAIALGSAFTAFFVVGLAIVIRREGHVIGWLFVGVAVYAMAQGAMAEVGEALLASGGTHIVYALSNVLFSWPTLLGVMVVVVPLLFPTGRLPSPRWRWLAWLTATALGVATVLNLVQRDVCVTYTDGGECVARVDNPLGIAAVENFEEGAIGAFGEEHRPHAAPTDLPFDAPGADRPADPLRLIGLPVAVDQLIDQVRRLLQEAGRRSAGLLVGRQQCQQLRRKARIFGLQQRKPCGPLGRGKLDQ